MSTTEGFKTITPAVFDLSELRTIADLAWRELRSIERDDQLPPNVEQRRTELRNLAEKVEGMVDDQCRSRYIATFTDSDYTASVTPWHLGPDGEYVPAAGQIEYENEDNGWAAAVMVGHSPVDGEMVVHIDGNPSRIYLNDHLILGEER